MGENLFESFDGIAVREDGEVHWAARAPYRPEPGFDLMLVPRVPDWWDHEGPRQALERIEAEPWVDSVSQTGDAVRLRLDDEWVETAGAELEAGKGALANGDLASGKNFAVYFWGANTTKALHIGHLRNLAVGNAIGASLAQGGGRVEHRSLICDVGRSMGEAMAGVVAKGGEEQVWPDGDEKSDHFVGGAYADYVKAGRNGGSAGDDGAEDSVARESSMYNDRADELMMRVLDGDQQAIELWSKTRSWVISGQRKTLSRLGVAFDKVIFESDFLPEVAELTNLGLGEGTLTKRYGDDMVMYETSREELEEMPLVRSDGLPTQHMRALAYWSAAPELDDCVSLQVCGNEWVSHVTCRRQLIDALGVSNGNGNGSAKGGGPPTHDIFHGMVARDSESISSSKKGALLIDELVEWVEREIGSHPGSAEVRANHPAPDRIPAQVALGYFLLQPTTKQVDFTPEKLLRENKESLGWDLARAQAHRGGAAELAGARPAEDPDYRFAVVQAEMYRRHLRSAIESFDAIQLARYLSHFSRWYCEAERPPEVERVVQTVLGQGVDGLGLGGQLMRTLLVDNHDSYTYNVFHLLAAASGEEPVVVNNDAVSWRVLQRSDFDAFVLSPGPGRPERWHDFGVCRDILTYSEVPVFGICLGHQGLGNLLEGGVNVAPEAMHGRLSHVHHSGTGLFEGVPQDFSVVRYHSLAITRSMGSEGEVTAWADDGVVMGIEHSTKPMWGVQFHPESVATEHGLQIARNFFAMADRHAAEKPRRRVENGPISPGVDRSAAEPEATAEPRLDLHWREFEGAAPTEQLYERLFGEAESAFWLDSADAPTWLAQCSYLGTSAGPGNCLLEYDVDAGEIVVERDGVRTVQHKSIFDFLDKELALNALEPPPAIARGLIGGFVGYLGYECKADTGARNLHSSDLPDAAFMLANRVLAVDHAKGRSYLFALGPAGDGEAERWLEGAAEVVAAAIAEPPPLAPLAAPEDPEGHVSFRCGRGRERYLTDILRSQAELAAGESYEVCLTDQISTDASPDPFALYRQLRRTNPAPFAAFLRFGENAIVSSSPERFLSVDRDRTVQARPIKGTISRHEDPAEDAARRQFLSEDEKTKAEHLMIVDLLRNDLGIVCDVGSVSVPELMVVEPYATVHQVVSTIVGSLEPHRSAAECVRACFPGGSMTGAPKERTMEIIDNLEAEARGVYSGAIGYFGVDGSTDLSIVIRTIVMRPGRTTIGAGGAIVMQSDPVEEFDEILLKARAPMTAIAEAVTGRGEQGEAWSVELEPARVELLNQGLSNSPSGIGR